MKCVACGFELTEGSKFCIECGAEQPQNKNCPQCNTVLPLAAKFCLNCGYSFANQSSGASSGIKMGDKNVVAGDVVGRKSNYNISGNATIVKNEDETKKIVRCKICGQNQSIINTHTCPVCGNSVCSNCYDSTVGMCIECKTNSKVSNENEYREALKKVFEDGRVDLSERRALEALRTKLNLSENRANELENEIKFGNSVNESFTTMEELGMEDATKLFYEEGNITEAYNRINSVYEKHQFNEKVLDIYLPILEEYNENKALDIINDLKADMLSAYLVKIDIYTKRDLSEAERILNAASKLWPDDFLLKCRRVNWLYKIYSKTKRDAFSQEISQITKSLTNTKNKLERTWKYRALDIQANLGKHVNFVSNEEAAKENIYLGYANCSIFVNNSKELFVNSDGSTDFSKIQEAVDFAREGTTIYIKSGTYNETLNIDKNIELIGDEDDMPSISISTGTVCKITSNAKLSNLHFENTSPNVEDSIEENEETGLVEISSNCTLENCEISDSFSIGVLISENSATNISNCDIHNNGIANIYVINDANPTIENCDIYGSQNGYNGIYIKNNASGTYQNCNIYTNSLYNIRIDTLGSPTISDCNIYDGNSGGLFIGNKGNYRITNCEIHNNCEDGVYLSDNSNPYIEDCDIYENSFNGVNINDESLGKIIKCRINDNNYSGIVTYNESNTLIEGCKIFSNSSNGIEMYNDSRCSVNNCSIYRNSSSQFLVMGKSNPQVSNCKLYDFDECNGFNITDDAMGTYTNCKVYDFNWPGIVLKGSSNPIFEDCEVYHGKGCGIYILGDAKGKFSDCIIKNNNNNNVDVAGNGNPIFEGCSISNSKSKGICVYGNATGIYKSCDIFSNEVLNVSVYEDANPTFDNCDIHDINSNTLCISGRATGLYKYCNLFNCTGSYPIVVAKEDSNPTIENCEIYSGNSYGIWIKDNATGTYSNCEVYAIEEPHIKDDSSKNPNLINNNCN